MKVLKKSNYDFINFEVFSKSYKYYSGEPPLINAQFVLVGLEEMAESSLLDELKVKVFFSSMDLDTPSFDNTLEFNVKENLNGNILSLKVPQLDLHADLYVYLKFYDTEGSILSYEKTFVEHIVSAGQVITANFVDLRFSSAIGEASLVQTQLEQDNSLIAANTKEKYNYNYISDLFYSFDKGERVNCFFGVDQKGYFIDNSPINFLKKDKEFHAYLEDNNFIIDVKTNVYDPETGTVHPVDVGLSSHRFADIFGTLYESNFKLVENFNSSREIKISAKCVLRDASSKYIIEVLKPQLEQEHVLMNNLNFFEAEFISISKASISRTLSLTQARYKEQFDDTSNKFIIFDNSHQIIVDNELAALLLSNNQHYYKMVNDLVEMHNPVGDIFNTTVSLFRDYPENINFSKINNGVQVMSFGNDLPSHALPSLSYSSLLSRAKEEVQKFFGDDTVQSYVAPDQQEISVDLVNNSFRGLTAQAYLINAETCLTNNKSLNYNFSYDTFLEYVQALNKIISKNIDYNLHGYGTGHFESVTPQEYITERSSEDVTGLLNSLTITQIPELKTERERKDYLTSIMNIVKTFKIPSTLTTDVCTDEKGHVVDDFTIQHSITPEGSIGNNVLAFSVMTAAESFANKDFYDFYKGFIKKDLDFNSLPIQSLFLYNYYNGETEQPAFLNKDSLLKQFVVYGIIYFMFKSLFGLKIFLPEQNNFVDLDATALSSLKANSEYLCRIDQYSNSDLGIKIPKLFQTTIYNRYFVLKTEGLNEGAPTIEPSSVTAFGTTTVAPPPTVVPSPDAAAAKSPTSSPTESSIY